MLARRTSRRSTAPTSTRASSIPERPGAGLRVAAGDAASTTRATASSTSTSRRTSPASRRRRQRRTAGAGLRRPSGRHLKRIAYGNRTPYFVDEADRRTPAPAPAGEFLFEVVLDYGEHDPDAARRHRPAPGREWAARPDSFSTYRSGFEIRTLPAAPARAHVPPVRRAERRRAVPRALARPRARALGRTARGHVPRLRHAVGIRAARPTVATRSARCRRSSSNTRARLECDRARRRTRTSVAVAAGRRGEPQPVGRPLRRGHRGRLRRARGRVALQREPR